MAGRPTKYTPDVVKRLTDAISMGAPYELACKYAGIHIDTFITWRKAKPEFSLAVENAEGSAVVGWLAKIEKAANDGVWTAAAWKLERRYPQMFARQVIEHQGSQSNPIVLDMAALTIKAREEIEAPDAAD